MEKLEEILEEIKGTNKRLDEIINLLNLQMYTSAENLQAAKEKSEKGKKIVMEAFAPMLEILEKSNPDLAGKMKEAFNG